MSGDDIIIGKTAAVKRDGTEDVSDFSLKPYKDCSTSLRHSESGIIDQVVLTTTGEGDRFTKVKMRAIRTP